MADKFKKGDIIIPVEGRKRSNGITLSDVTKLRIISYIPYNSYTDEINCMVLAGALKGQIVTVIVDAFKLESKKDDYSIF